MINRLIAYIDQVKKLSSERIYFDDLWVRTKKPDKTLVEIEADCSADKKGGEFFKGKRFFIERDTFFDFVKNYKKSITDIVITGNDLEICTSIPGVSLKFIWTDKNEKEFNELKVHHELYKKTFGDLKKVAEIHLRDKLQIGEFVKTGRFYVTPPDELSYKEGKIEFRIFPKKYLGKITSTTKEIVIDVKEFDKFTGVYAIRVSIKNSNLWTYHNGMIVNPL